MPTFHYTALNTEGEQISATLEAASETEALAELKSRGCQAIEITRDDSASSQADADPSRAEVIFDEDLGPSLETITGAGLPLESGLRLLAETHPSSRVSNDLLQLSKRLERGESWEQIAGSESANLPLLYQQLFQLKLGPGELSAVLNRYLYHARHAIDARRKIWGGLIYSLVILFSLILISAFVLVGLVPQFKLIYEGFDTDLPFSTVALIDFSDFFRNYGWIVIVSLFAAPIVLWQIGGPSVKRFLQRLTRYIPVTGKAFKGVSLSTFCHLLAELVQRKIPLDVAVKFAADGTGDLTLQYECHHLAEQIRQGVPLADALSSLSYCRDDVSHVFRWASKSREFVDVLHGAGDGFRGQARARAGLIPIVVEPFMLFLVLVMGGTFAGVVFLPLIKLLNDLS